MSDERPPVVDVVERASNKGGRPARQPEEWMGAYLEYVRTKGNPYKAARVAGISPNTVRKYRRQHPEFTREIRDALREYGASLEENLGDLAFKGNAIANIARLKALNQRLAAKYSEKAVDARVLNQTTNNVVVIGDAQLAGLFQSMVRDALPESLAQLAGPVLLHPPVGPGETPGRDEETP